MSCTMPWTPLFEAGPIAPSRLVGLPYFSRSDWGADESLRFAADGTELFPTAYFPVQTLTVHHTVTANNDPDPVGTVQSIYRFHAVDPAAAYGDIGYHFLIDELGRVYEGRFSDDDGTPAHDAQQRMVNAAHVGGFNAGNIGVALLGDLTGRQPALAARSTLVHLLAALAVAHDLDAVGTTDYVNPISGAQRQIRTISGHRDWLANECPGNSFAPTLEQLRLDVAALVSTFGKGRHRFGVPHVEVGMNRPSGAARVGRAAGSAALYAGTAALFVVPVVAVIWPVSSARADIAAAVITASFDPGTGVLTATGDGAPNAITVSRTTSGTILVNGGAVAITVVCPPPPTPLASS